MKRMSSAQRGNNQPTMHSSEPTAVLPAVYRMKEESGRPSFPSSLYPTEKSSTYMPCSGSRQSQDQTQPRARQWNKKPTAQPSVVPATHAWSTLVSMQNLPSCNVGVLVICQNKAPGNKGVCSPVNPTIPEPPEVMRPLTFQNRHSKSSQSAGSQQLRTSGHCQR